MEIIEIFKPEKLLFWSQDQVAPWQYFCDISAVQYLYLENHCICGNINSLWRNVAALLIAIECSRLVRNYRLGANSNNPLDLPENSNTSSEIEQLPAVKVKVKEEQSNSNL